MARTSLASGKVTVPSALTSATFAATAASFAATFARMASALSAGTFFSVRRFSRCSRAFAWWAATLAWNSAAGMGNFFASSPRW
jgi:hypothetical protein